MCLSNDLSHEAGSFSCCSPNPHRCFHSEVCGFISPCWIPGLLGLLCSPPFVQFMCEQMWGCGVLPTALPAPFSATVSPALSVYLHECGATGSACGQTACPVHPTLHQFWSRHGNSSPLRPASPPLLPVWMNVYFLSPWCRTSLTFDFLSVLVVRGCTVCLPTPPSWFSPQYSYY